MAGIGVVSIKLKRNSRLVCLQFSDGLEAELSFEYLRVYSPSAEVRGHGKGQEVLQWGKRNVGIRSVEPVGHYAIKINFDDGHDTGLYSWDYLHELALEQTQKWDAYLQKLQDSKLPRDADIQILKL